MSFMIPIITQSDAETEHKYLIQHLHYTSKMINNNFSSYLATVDKSGAVPQLHITKKK